MAGHNRFGVIMITLEDKQEVSVDIDTLKQNAQKILDFLGYQDFDLGIQLANLEHMHELNKKYRKKDKPTDILSFLYYPDLKAGQKINPKSPEGKNLGDIIICPAYVKQDLDRWNQSFENRMQTLLIHGICHLLGYDHVNDEDYDAMRKKEAEIQDFLNA